MGRRECAQTRCSGHCFSRSYLLSFPHPPPPSTPSLSYFPSSLPALSTSLVMNDAAEAALGLLGLNSSAGFRTAPTIPLKRKSSAQNNNPPKERSTQQPVAESDSIRCICGYSDDDGFSVACDICSRWVHGACFSMYNDREVPDKWRCWVCEPRRVDRERAVRIQSQRFKQLALAPLEVEKQKRRVSPGVERKPRKVNVAPLDTNSQPAPKRKRRMSVNTHPPNSQHPHLTEDEHIDIDEPPTNGYIHIDTDLVPNSNTRDRLKRLAQHWRGVTALDSPTTPIQLSPDAIPPAPQTSIRPLPVSAYSHPLSSNSNPSVLPPSYALHTTQPISSSTLIAPYTSTIVPSNVYLSDPLNSYAHLSLPKPFVHLFGPPLDVALDARTTGRESRFVRSGCRPNAILRPLLCHHRHQRENPCSDPSSEEEDNLSFGVFALRDLKANEEIVLGWEWDDGSVIHHLPALISSPHLFA